MKAKTIAMNDCSVVSEEDDDSCYDNGIDSVKGEIEQTEDGARSPMIEEAKNGGEGEAEGGGDGIGDGGGGDGPAVCSWQHESEPGVVAGHVAPTVAAQHLASHGFLSTSLPSHLHWLVGSLGTHVGGEGGGIGGGEGEAEGGGEGFDEGGGDGGGEKFSASQHEVEAGHVAPTVAAQQLTSHGLDSFWLAPHSHWLVGSLGTQISGGGGAGGGIGGGEGLSCPLAVVARSIGSHCGEQATPWTTEACVFDPSAEVWVSMVPRTARVRKLMALRAVCCATEADEVEGV